ncbi:MAG: AI-2E family transporter, partial [Natronospirillum sp.]
MRLAMEKKFFLLLLTAVTIAFALLLRPFWGAIFWAVAITIIFAPVNHWFLKRFGQRRVLASLTTLLCCVVVVLVPLTFILYQVLDQAATLSQNISEGEMDPANVFASLSRAFPIIPNLLGQFD